MKQVAWIAVAAVALTPGLSPGVAANGQPSEGTSAYLGFDRNDYPGDDSLKPLRRTFSFTGFWLSHPPGEKANTWAGKRRAVESAGFGFLLLFNGRLFAELKTVANAIKLGKSDAQLAISAARREGFPVRAIIFLDQEEGGRMLVEQKAYIFAWVDEVVAGGFRAGVYCSGIAAQEDGGVTVITAEDVHKNAGKREIAYWVTNDACPPSPGCAFPRHPPGPAESGWDFAEVWQYAQSPKRPEVASGCPKNYHPDGSCYVPGIDSTKHFHVDLNVATSADPSQGRTP